MKEEVEEPQEVEEDHPGHPPQQHQKLRSYQQQSKSWKTTSFVSTMTRVVQEGFLAH